MARPPGYASAGGSDNVGLLQEKTMETLFALMGYIGLVLMLLAYFLLVIGQLLVTDGHHILMNLIGALFVMISIHTDNEVPVFAALLLWLFISLYGFYKHHLASPQ